MRQFKVFLLLLVLVPTQLFPVGILNGLVSEASEQPSASQEEVYLSDLDWVSATSGWKSVQKDKNVDGQPIKMDGGTYTKGLGTHANSEIVYHLEGQYALFQATVGPDDKHINNPAKATSIIFQVYADGEKLYDSGVMRMYPLSTPQDIAVNVEGVNELRLVVDNAGDPPDNPVHSDWANWANARLTPVEYEGLVLSQLTVDGEALENFSPTIFTYDVVLPVGTTEVPEVTATAEDPNTEVIVAQANELPGQTVIELTKGEATTTYTINFSVKGLALDTVTLVADKTELNPLLNPSVTSQVTVSAYMTDGTTVDFETSGATVKYTIESLYKSGDVKVASVDQNGVVTPTNDGGLARVTAEVTLNGITKKGSIDIVVRPFYREYHQTLTMKMFMGQNGNVNLNFEQGLEVIKKMDNLTRGIPKIVYLVGWQYDGHDSKYPAWDEVNVRLKRPQDESAVDSLKWLMEEAKKYNTTVSLHINMLDASMESPLWDDYLEKDIIAREEDGSLREYRWGYPISYAREWELGLTQRRIDRLMEMLPLSEGGTIHVDAFHTKVPGYSDISPWHAKTYGYTTAVEEETQRKIFKYWRAKGVDVTSEFTNDYRNESFIGLQPMAWHFSSSAFNLIDIPASLYTGGDRGDNRYGEAMLGEGTIKADPDTLKGFLEEFSTKTLPWYFLNRLTRISDDGAVVTFSDDVVSYREGSKNIIKQGDRVLRDGSDVFIPALWNEANYKEIIAYSKAGYTDRTWELLDDWEDVTKVDIYDIGLTGLNVIAKDVPVTQGSLTLSLEADQGVTIVPAGTEIGETPEDVCAASMKALVEQFEDEGEFANDGAARSLQVHLTAVSRYEEKELAEKVVKHMKGFKLLLDHQQENGLISERAYNILKANADSLIKKWQ